MGGLRDRGIVHVITDLIGSVVVWFLETTLTAFSWVIPSTLVAVAESGFGTLGHMLSYGPAGLVGICFLS